MSTDKPNPTDEVMCHCSGTKRENIRQLAEQGMDMHAISRWTGALSGCGGCEWDIADFLKEVTAKPHDNSLPESK
ncbi:MAG: (2Fe-2S)-binding protein [Gallionella sp.]|nr:(2Fe-2S)-binding protein [Gallionella sp.]MDD4946339.1 (2Fe-2S)-binding protein [Gallionella sp.]MDD5611910.1 (2Fe-2S)-binding protein [Gallionella sp.]